jgi:hypothetical protein
LHSCTILAINFPKVFTFLREQRMIRRFLVGISVPILLSGVLAFGQSDQKPMTNADVVKMVQAGQSVADIKNAIRRATPNFAITEEALASLQQQKVPESIISAMIIRQDQWDAAQRQPNKPSRPAPVVNGPKWEVEVYGGITKIKEKALGVGLPVAEAYSLAGSGAQGYWSERVSSYYFGEGAQLVQPSSTLDTTLKGPIVQPKEHVIGVRASRALNSRIAFELSFDTGGQFTISKEGLAQIEAARAGFQKFWSRLDVPGNTPATSVSAINPRGGRQTFATGAVVFSFRPGQMIRPYATGGLGMFFGSRMPEATLVGSYGGPNASETDTLHLYFAQTSNHALAPVAGGGVKIYLSPHWGIRIDARAYFYQNLVTNLVDTNHTNTANVGWIVNATDANGKTVNILQKVSGPGFESYSTLSGPPITRLKTSTGSGYQRLIPITVGFFLRL